MNSYLLLSPKDVCWNSIISVGLVWSFGKTLKDNAAFSFSVKRHPTHAGERQECYKEFLEGERYIYSRAVFLYLTKTRPVRQA